MYVDCPNCGRLHDDEHTSTVCPHKGLGGLCVVCDCYNCVCNPNTKNPRSNRYGGKIHSTDETKGMSRGKDKGHFV